MPNIHATTTRPATLYDVDEIAILFNQYRQFYKQTPDLVLAKTFISERLSNKDSVILVAAVGDGDVNISGAKNLFGFCQIYPVFARLRLQKLVYCMIYLWLKLRAKRAQAAL